MDGKIEWWGNNPSGGSVDNDLGGGMKEHSPIHVGLTRNVLRYGASRKNAVLLTSVSTCPSHSHLSTVVISLNNVPLPQSGACRSPVVFTKIPEGYDALTTESETAL